MDTTAEVPVAPLAAGAFSVPDARTLADRVLAALKEATDPKSARALVVAELQAAKASATAGFETAFRAAPRHARAPQLARPRPAAPRPSAAEATAMGEGS